jgi:hypothetical protein
VGPVDCYWASPAQSVLVSGPVQTHDYIYVFPKILTCFEKGPPLQRAKGSGYHWSRPFCWGWHPEPVVCDSVVLVLMYSKLNGTLTSYAGRNFSWETKNRSACKTFPVFHGTRRSITVFTRASHWFLAWGRRMQSSPYHPSSLRSISAWSPFYTCVSVWTFRLQCWINFLSPPYMLNHMIHNFIIIIW